MSQEYGYVAVRETIDRARNEAVSSLKPKAVTEQVSRTEATQSNTTEMKKTDIIANAKELKTPYKEAKEEVKSDSIQEAEDKELKESSKPSKYTNVLIGGGVVLLLIGGYFIYKKIKK